MPDAVSLIQSRLDKLRAEQVDLQAELAANQKTQGVLVELLSSITQSPPYPANPEPSPQ